jgi:hypothetical protein
MLQPKSDSWEEFFKNIPQVTNGFDMSRDKSSPQKRCITLPARLKKNQSNKNFAVCPSRNKCGTCFFKGAQLYVTTSQHSLRDKQLHQQ